MDTFLAHATATDLVAIALGLALLVLGRRLFWLALAGVGFLAAVVLSQHFLHEVEPVVRLALALLAGIAGAFVAVFAQQLALAVAGFLLGAFGTAWGLQFLAPDLGGWALALAVVGGIVGVVLAQQLFEVALVLVSAAAGASLVAGASGLRPPEETWLGLGLFVVGLAVQLSGGDSGRRRRRRQHRVRDD